jgi:hypothetical protein
MAWSVDRLGRSLQDLVDFLSELHALRIDLFLHQQGLEAAKPILPTVEDCANGYRTAALTLAQGNELGVDDVPAPSQSRPANPAGPADPG